MPPFLKQLVIWTIVCSASAAPSFVLALAEWDDAADILAMEAGIACFVVAYALVSCTRWAQRLRRRPFATTTLKIGYGTRILLSLSSAIALGGTAAWIAPDLWIGYYSALFVMETLGFEEDAVLTVFALTIVVGGLWNVVLGVYMLLVHGVQLMFRQKPPPDGACEVCGYGLRASSGVCPECGTLVPSPPESRPLAA
jgi:hypothetical protein